MSGNSTRDLKASRVGADTVLAGRTFHSRIVLGVKTSSPVPGQCIFPGTAGIGLLFGHRCVQCQICSGGVRLLHKEGSEGRQVRCR